MIIELFKKKPVRFAIVSLFVLIFKIAITATLETYSNLEFYLNYLIAHIVVLVFSYFNHSKFTFGSNYKIKSFFAFTSVVLLLKLLDYILAIIGVYVFNQFYIVAIITATIINFVLRYFILNRYVFKTSNQRK